MSRLNASDILQMLHDAATPRDWTAHPSPYRAEAWDLWAGSEHLARFTGAKAREDTDLVIRIRNTLPEILRSMSNRDFRVSYLEGQLTPPTTTNRRCPNCDHDMGGEYFAEHHYIAPAGEWTCHAIDWRGRALAAEERLRVLQTH